MLSSTHLKNFSVTTKGCKDTDIYVVNSNIQIKGKDSQANENKSIAESCIFPPDLSSTPDNTMTPVTQHMTYSNGTTSSASNLDKPTPCTTTNFEEGSANMPKPSPLLQEYIRIKLNFLNQEGL